MPGASMAEPEVEVVEVDLREWVAEVTVLPKPGVNDPQGEAIRGGLAMLGHGDVTAVRSGRFIRLTLRASDATTAASAVADMCERLLANPVIETYDVAIAEAVETSGLTDALGVGPR